MRRSVIGELNSLGAKLLEVPKVGTATLPSENLVNWLLNYSEGKSVLYDKQEREGIVLKNVNNPDNSFKVISNKFLLKGGDD